MSTLTITDSLLTDIADAIKNHKQRITATTKSIIDKLLNINIINLRYIS